MPHAHSLSYSLINLCIISVKHMCLSDLLSTAYVIYKYSVGKSFVCSWKYPVGIITVPLA